MSALDQLICLSVFGLLVILALVVYAVVWAVIHDDR